MYSIEYIELDYLNFVVISTITYLSAVYLYHLNRLFFETVAASLTDELTKLRNLKGYNEVSQKAFKEAEANKHSLNLILFDIDYFKDVNDTYGHLAGNYILVELAGILRQLESLNYGKRAFRIGGEEFALIISGKSEPEAIGIAEDVRQKVANYFFSYEGQTIHITVSLGVAEYSTNMEDLYSKADEALYRSKKAGRNQVQS